MNLELPHKNSESIQDTGKGNIEDMRKNDYEKHLEQMNFNENGKNEQKPMTIKDSWLSLRRSIQEKIDAEKLESTEKQEGTKLLSELITPDLMDGYKQIFKEFREKTRKTEDHPNREFIDINNEEFFNSIENWIDNLVNEVRNKKETGLNESDIEDLREQCWLFFDSVGCVMNTKSLEKEIVDFYKDGKNNELDKKEQKKQKLELVKELQSRYPAGQVEIKALMDLVESGDGEKENYSPKIFIETINQLRKQYNLDDKKGKVAKISLGYLAAKGLTSYSPSLFQNLIEDDKFKVAVFLEFIGLGKIADIVEAKAEIELAKVTNEISQEINERITDSLFFQEFEFTQEKSLGEIYESLQKGKESTEKILKETISKFVPALSGIGMSLAFLTQINPVLGAIGIGSLPIMYKIAKKQNEGIEPMYEKEKREGEKIATRLGAIKSGLENIKTSPDTPFVARHVKDQMNTKDTLTLQRTIEEVKMRFKRIIPFDISTVSAAIAGGALQEAGKISGGAILSNVIYSNMLNQPIKELVELYFSDFSRYTQNIQRMDKILGEYEKVDLPEGEKEKNRMPVSELENFDISIKNLHYKDILQGVNINIKQGEFLTIAGASGAGKSTLLRNLAGLYKPNSGEIEIGGVKNDKIKKYGKESIYSIMSYCNQNPQIFDGMTLRENLILWSKEEASDEKIKKVLQDLHLDKFIDKLDEEVKNLSGGEKVRIGVARTLIKEVKIMLLDEPTASLDSQASTEVRKIISEINKKYPDTTIICVSHDPELIKSGGRSVNITELQK